MKREGEGISGVVQDGLRTGEYERAGQERPSETFINFAQNKIGNYYVKDSEDSRFDGRTPERLSVLVGGVANGGRTENTGRKGTDVPGVVSDGGRADLLEGRGSSSPEGTFGDELIFSYAEWKSNPKYNETS